MDPITHGLIGLAISAFSGDPVNIANPVSIGCALGAISPDLDVVVRFVKDDAYYLKHHRGKSHSLPFLALFSVGITAMLSFIYLDMAFLNVLLWTFIGALSHTVMDTFNSYGAQILKKKRKLSILTLYDPVLGLLGIFLVLYDNKNTLILVSTVVLSVIYMFIRYFFKLRAEKHLFEKYSSQYEIYEVCVLPSLKIFYKWDFVIHCSTHNLVGQYNQFNDKIKIVEVFEVEKPEMMSFFKTTNLGVQFGEFSPNYHISTEKLDDDLTLIRAIDLRYFFKNQFLHNATMIIDSDFNIVESSMHPYTMRKKIPVFEG